MDRAGFEEKLATNPLKLQHHNAGGTEGHTRRIQAALDAADQSGRFDAAFLAQLRYDKKSKDSFDGVCNKAMHLFTSHEAILTEQMNVNFVFSGWEAKLSQWSYLYARLPYILLYTLSLIEHITNSFAETLPEYQEDVARRIAALLALTWSSTDPYYQAPRIEQLVRETVAWLLSSCAEHGYSQPTEDDLHRMAHTGAYPGESEATRSARIEMFERYAAESRKG